MSYLEGMIALVRALIPLARVGVSMTREPQTFKTPHEISDRIVVVRGLKVLLDSDLAALYGVATKRLNEKVRRHSERFPPDFMFLLSPGESGVSQVADCDLKTRAPSASAVLALRIHRVRRLDGCGVAQDAACYRNVDLLGTRDGDLVLTEALFTVTL